MDLARPEEPVDTTMHEEEELFTFALHFFFKMAEESGRLPRFIDIETF